MSRILAAAAGFALLAASLASSAMAEQIVIVQHGASQTFGGELLQTAGRKKVTERNVKLVEFEQGDFKYMGNQKWVERTEAGDVAFTYEEAGRFPGEVKLWDAARQVHISLSLGSMMILYAPDGQDLAPLYPITGLEN